jgi:translation initiation factor IF-3
MDAAREAGPTSSWSPLTTIARRQDFDYGAAPVEQKKKAEARKKRNPPISKIKMRPNIDVHDYEVARRSAASSMKATR